jgi:outer membrane receptor protein involved in Fe transport
MKLPMLPKPSVHFVAPGARRRLALAATFSLLTLNAAFAQATNSAPSTASAEKDKKDAENPVLLSPFMVDSSKDQGYRATNTLAGSRISTELKDVAAPLTVVTKEFLIDVNAVDVNDILSYTANTEGTRDYTASTPTLGRPSDGVAANAQQATRVRGLEAPNTMRDYFFTIGTGLGFDTYNLDQVTISKGPNSMLAGLGHAAGVINFSPVPADMSRNRNEATYRYGSFGDQRVTLDANVVAMKDVLAVRVAGMMMNKGYKQEPAFNHDRRLYATVTYKPWSKTTIRAGYEIAKVKSNEPNSITPEDDITQWVALGKPSYDRNSATPVSSFLWGDGNLPTVVYNKAGAIEGAFNTSTGYLFNQQNLNNVGIWTPLRMSNNTYLQLDEVNTSPSLANRKLTTTTVSIDQEILPKLYANVAYLHEKGNDNRLDLFRPEYANYLVDVNVRTPTGAANPHYGETYMQFRGLDNSQADNNSNRVARASLNYELDLTKHNKWFGRYRLTGFAEDRETEFQHLQYNAKGTNNSTRLAETGARYYLGGTATTPAGAVPKSLGLVSNVTNTYFDSTSGTFKTDTLTNFYALKSDQRKLEKLTSSAVVLQGYLWDDRIVGLFGIRRDKDRRGFDASVEGDPGATDPVTGLVYPAKGSYGTLAEKAAQTKTYGVVVHPLKWLSLHYNRSENFDPNAGSVDLLGKPTTTPTGQGRDYGFSIRLLDDKLNAKFNWFETTAKDGPAGNPANFPLAQWNMTFMDLVVEPELAAKAGITYKRGVAPGITVGDPRLENAYTANNSSKGLELELTYNVTKNWRVMANVSKQEAKQTDIASSLTGFIEERLAYWKSIPALWTGQVTSNNPWGLQQTGEQHFNQFLLGSYVGYKSVDGQPSTQIRKWHGNIVSTYDFTEGALKGFSVGGAARYLDRGIIGNPAIRDATGAVVALDLAHPYYSNSYIAVDAWVGYKMRILAEKYPLSFQLNIRDLQEGGSFRPIVANSDGTHAVYRIVQPRTFYFTTRFEF